MSENAPEPSARPRRRRALRAIAALLILIVALVALLPTLASTAIGNRVSLGLGEAISGYALEAEAVSVGWWSGPEARGLQVKAPGDAWSLSIDRFAAPSAGLFTLAVGGRDLGAVEAGHIRIADRRGDAAGSESPATRSEDNGSSAPNGSGDAGGGFPEIPDGLNVSASVEKITYERPDEPTATVTGLEARARTKGEQRLEASLSARVALGTSEPGEIVADIAYRGGESPSLDASASAKDLPVGALDRLLQQNGLLPAALGPRLSLQARATGAPTEPTVDVRVTSERLTAEAKLRRKGGALTSEGTPTVAWRVEPALVDRLLGAGAGVELAEAATLRLAIDRLRLPRRADAAAIPAWLGAAEAGLRLELDGAELAVPGVGDVGLADMRLTVESGETLGEAITARLTGRARTGETSGTVAANLRVASPLTPKNAAATLEAAELPVALADAALAGGGRYAAAIGKTVSAKLDARRVDGAVALDGKVTSPRLELPIAARIERPGAADRILRLRTPEDAAWTVTPEAFAAWRGLLGERASGWGLTSAATLSTRIEHLALAMRPEGGIDFRESGVVASLRVPTLEAKRIDGGARYRVAGFRHRIEGRDLREGLDLILEAVVETAERAADGTPQAKNEATTKPTPRTVRAEVKARNLVADDGALAWRKAQGTAKARLHRVPTGLLHLAPEGPTIAALLGDHFSGELDAALPAEGEPRAALALESPQSRIQLAGRVDREERVALEEDARLAVSVTPESSRRILARINPLLGSVVSAKAPVDITVPADAFSLPLRPFSLERATGALEIGRSELTLVPEGLAGMLFGLLDRAGVTGGKARHQAVVEATSMRLEAGTLAYDGLAIDVSGVRFTFSGGVNLARGGELDMSVALGGSRLPRELRGVAVPVAGTATSPKLGEGAVEKILVQAGARGVLERALGDDGKAAGALLDAVLGGGSGQRPDEKKKDGKKRERRRNPFGALLEGLAEDEDEKKKDE